MEKLAVHAWPGNVRELQHAILHAALREDGPLLEGYHFQPQRVLNTLTPNPSHAERGPHARGEGRLHSPDEAWKQAVARALREARGNKSRAAAALGVTRKTLYAWMRECGLA